MVEVRNCKMCNMVFASRDNAVLCKKCQKQDEVTFKSIRDYLYDNPGTSVQELSARFNLNVGRIGEYIRNGGLSAK